MVPKPTPGFLPPQEGFKGIRCDLSVGGEVQWPVTFPYSWRFHGAHLQLSMRQAFCVVQFLFCDGQGLSVLLPERKIRFVATKGRLVIQSCKMNTC